MANWQWNKIVKGRQVRTLIVAGGCLFFIVAMMIVLLADGRPKRGSLQEGTKFPSTHLQPFASLDCSQ